ncbi:unnamed protein product [Rotaria sp. Silwood1]|nr:unnamed protein product [Rotaria sp. Silwood1]
MEMKAMSFEKIIPVQKINKQETIISTNGRIGDPLTSNEYANRNLLTASNQTTTITSPLVILPTQIYKPSIIFPPPIANQCQSSPNTISSSTILLMDQMKTLSISSTSIPPITSSRLVSIVSYLGEYEIVDTTIKTDIINEQYSSSSINEIIKNDHPWFQSKSNNKNDQSRDISTSTPSNDGGIRFANTSRGPPTTSSM